MVIKNLKREDKKICFNKKFDVLSKVVIERCKLKKIKEVRKAQIGQRRQ